MKYQFYAIIFDVAGNATPVGNSVSPAKSFVTNIQKVTGISINPSGSVTKNIGENFIITATVSPTDANNKTINWDSSNKAVATVDSNGKVTCLSAGSTTITATAADGSGVSVNLSLTVRNPINSLTLDKDQTTILKDGYTSTVTATTDPASYDGANITWTIADTSIATVTVSGKTATIKSTSKLGTTTLTVTAGNITKTVKVTVTNFITITYSYTGSVQQVDLPAGTYKLECWGAQGGSYNTTYSGGNGGYSSGILTLSQLTTLYVYVGQQGYAASGTARSYCWNGGGGTKSSGNIYCGGGGGATDIATWGSNNSTTWNSSSHFNSRIIVAGGGGGGASYTNSNNWGIGGSGGGIVGNVGKKYTGSTFPGGSQTSGGSALNCGSGGFGLGGSGVSASGNPAGAGSGWYGGCSGDDSAAGGGGGSGYVYTSSTASNYPSGCLLNSSYYLTNAQTIAGNQSFPNVAGTGNETGHSGNGAAKITPVN